LRLLVPYLALSFWSLCGALTTGLGRSQFGASYALSSRYTTISSLLWLSNAVLAYLLVTLERRGSESAAGYRWRTYGATGVLVVLVLSAVLSAATGIRSFVHWKQHLEPARAALIALDDPASPLLTTLWEDTETLWERALVLREHGLSVYRDRD
jgi:hypothetical protein